MFHLQRNQTFEIFLYQIYIDIRKFSDSSFDASLETSIFFVVVCQPLNLKNL